MKTKFTRLLIIFILGSFSLSFAQEDSVLNSLKKFWRDAYNNPQVSSLHKTSPDEASSIIDFTVLAKAQADEDYYGIGDPRNNYDPSLREFNGTPKVNDAYVWGVVKNGANIWFGTAPNVLCLVEFGYLGITGGQEIPNCWVCEGLDTYRSYPTALMPDWRPPRIFMYNTLDKSLVEKTDLLDDLGRTRLNHTLGLRSAGSFNGVVFIAGPNTGGIGPRPPEPGAHFETDGYDGGINIFAFNATTGEFIDSYTLGSLFEIGGYGWANNVRKWIVANGALYFGIGIDAGVGSSTLNKSVDQTDMIPGGAVLRWRGTVDDPFQFEVVGLIGGDAAELVLHNGRIYVNTWPIAKRSTSGIWRSPLIPPDGLTEANRFSWRPVWNVLQYEPDPVVAMTYGGGAIASYGGKLYWGTMHVPFLAGMALIEVYGHRFTSASLDGPPHEWDTEDYIMAILGGHRATTIFRGDFDNIPDPPVTASSISDEVPVPGANVELLYGNVLLPRYYGPPPSPDASEEIPGGPVGWKLVPNNMHQIPLYGLAGINNFFNNYCWAMDVYKNRLYIGTMDWSFLAYAPLNALTDRLPIGLDDILQQLGLMKYLGADLWKFTSPNFPAMPVSQNGLNNETSYGVRNLFNDGSALYAGMANPMNLSPKGGWELIRVEGAPGAETTSSNMFLITPNGGEYYTPGAKRNIIWILNDGTVPGSSTNTNNLLSKSSGGSSTTTTPYYVKIEYSTNRGASWNIIKSRYLATCGYFTWTVPNTPSNQCLVRVTKFGESGNYVVSLDVFTIGSNALAQLMVWPGDADNDGDVDQADWDALKLYENKTGTPRATVSSEWAAQTATAWVPAAATYADCNGDGVVDANDFYVVMTNWGLTHTVLGKSNVTVNEFALRQNYPNPFNPSTQIQFELPENSSVSLKIYSMLGEEVATLINDINFDSGIHKVEWRPDNLSSGIYIYRLVANSHESNKEFSMVKKLQYLR